MSRDHVSFEISDADRDLVRRCVDRFADKYRELNGRGFPRDQRISLMMDLTATNANGCPMDFERLIAADDFNFLHDVGGIRRHLDRTTGELGDCFLPRFARPKTEEELEPIRAANRAVVEAHY